MCIWVDLDSLVPPCGQRHNGVGLFSYMYLRLHKIIIRNVTAKFEKGERIGFSKEHSDYHANAFSREICGHISCNNRDP